MRIDLVPQKYLTGRPAKLLFTVDGLPSNPYADIEGEVRIIGSGGSEASFPLFWSGGKTLEARGLLRTAGQYRFSLKLKDVASSQIVTYSGNIVVDELPTDEAAYPAPICRNPDGRYLQNASGEPFLWLGDTWWYGATRRCRWPEPFRRLAKTRVEQGFNVVQIVIGIPPEVSGDHPDTVNEGGPPFLRQWDLVNPDYFRYVDLRIEYLIEVGIVPCIVGAWGFQIEWFGLDWMKRYWRYLLARYGAYPVIWCLSGESDLDAKLLPAFSHRRSFALSMQRIAVKYLPPTGRQVLAWLKHRTVDHLTVRMTSRTKRRTDWQEVGDAVADADAGQHLVTIHPVNGVYSFDAVNGADWLELDGIQSGHSYTVRNRMVNQIRIARTRRPNLPIINLEPWYEGILGQFFAVDQRYAFWLCMLAGAAGHTYGAHGVWQMATDDGFLAHWGNAHWRTALNLPGAAQLGCAKRILAQFEWWKLTPSPNSLEPHWSEDDPYQPFLSRIEDHTCVIYFPAKESRSQVSWYPSIGQPWRAVWYDPRSGVQRSGVLVQASTPQRGVVLPSPPDSDDWVLTLHRVAEE